MKKIQLEIHLKGGGSFTADVEEWRFKKSGGETSLTWKTPARSSCRRLVHVDLTEVAAIVEVTR